MVRRGIISSGKLGGFVTIEHNMMEFNGTDRQIDYGSSLGITGNQISVHWIGRTGPDVTTDRAICSDWDSTGFLLYVFNGELYFQIDGVFAKTAIAASTKYDILATYDGTNIKIAVNAVNVATQAHTGNIGASGVNFLVGQYQSNDRFDGQYSNLTVYPVALEPNAAELYNGGLALQSWERSSKFKNNYAFAGNFNSGAADGRRYVDYSGNNRQPTVSGTPTFTGALQAYEFNSNKFNMFGGDGSTKYVNFGNDSSLDLGDGNFSHSIWFKTASSSSQQIMNKLDLPGDDYWDIYMDAGQLHARVYEDSFGTERHYRTDNTFDDNEVHHLVVVWNGYGTYKIYVDSNDETLTQLSGDIIAGPISNGNDFYTGARSEFSLQAFDGDLSKPLVYSKNLTTLDVKVLYNRGLPKDLNELPIELRPTDIDCVLAVNMNSDDNSLNDLSGNSNDGSAVAGYTSDGAELNFDSTEEFQTLSGDMLSMAAAKYLQPQDNLFRLTGATKMTATFQFDIDSLSSADTAFIGSWSSNGWMVYIDTSTSILFYTNGNTLPYSFSGKSGIINIMVRMDGSTKEIWCDNELVANNTGGVTINSSGLTGGSINNYGTGTDRSQDMDTCCFQVFDDWKEDYEIFYGKNLILRADDPDLVFGITGLDGNSELTDQSANAMAITNVGSVAADGIASSFYLDGSLI